MFLFSIAILYNLQSERTRQSNDTKQSLQSLFLLQNTANFGATVPYLWIVTFCNPAPQPNKIFFNLFNIYVIIKNELVAGSNMFL